MRVTNGNSKVSRDHSNGYINGLNRTAYMCDLESLRYMLRNPYIIETIDINNPSDTAIYNVMRRVCDNVQLVLNDHYSMDSNSTAIEPDIWEYARIMCDSLRAVMCDDALLLMVRSHYGSNSVIACEDNDYIANSYMFAVIAGVCSECCYLSDGLRDELEHRAYLYERHAIALEYGDVPDVDMSVL